MKTVSPPSIKGKRMLAYNEAHEYTRCVPTYLTDRQRERDAKIIRQIAMAHDVEGDAQKVLDIFFGKCRLLSNTAYWETLRTVWVAVGSTELTDRFLPYFRSTRGARSWFMTPEDTAALNSMTFPIRLYRAYDDDDDRGVSWTSNRDWCEKYAVLRGRRMKTAEFNRDDIYAYISRRGEDEFIILSTYQKK